MIDIYYITDKGNVSQKNDDRVYVNGSVFSNGQNSVYSENACVAICDGVGGELFGDEAAEIVANSISDLDLKNLNEAYVKSFAQKVNENVCSMQKNDAAHSKMASTLAFLYLDENGFYSFNVGDTRIYRYFSPYIMQISTDNSLAEENIMLGLPSNEKQSHILTRCFGSFNAVPNIKAGTDTFRNNEVFIICSDGLWNFVSDKMMENIIKTNANSKQICQELFNEAINNNSDDNISVIVIRRV